MHIGTGVTFWNDTLGLRKKERKKERNRRRQRDRETERDQIGRGCYLTASTFSQRRRRRRRRRRR